LKVGFKLVKMGLVSQLNRLKQLDPLKQLNVLEGYHINMELVLVKEHELLWCCRMG